MLPGSTLSGGEWIYPNRQPVKCNNNSNSDPLHCSISNNPPNITVYRSSDTQPFYEISIKGSQIIGGEEVQQH